MAAVDSVVAPLDADWAFSADSLCVQQQVLGVGSLGEVRAAVLHGTPVAAKMLHFEKAGSSLSDRDRSTVLKQLLKECSFLRRMRHPNIVAFMGVAIDADRRPLWLVTECLKRTLHSALHDDDSLPAHQEGSVLRGIARALAYLHAQEFIHRDVKSKNVLLDAFGVPKLCDLGEGFALSLRRRAETLGVGTLAYMSPEMKVGDVVKGTAVDVFSFGVLVAEVSARVEPDPGPDYRRGPRGREFVGQVERYAVLLGATQSPELRRLATACLADEPEDRPSAAAVLADLEELVRLSGADATAAAAVAAAAERDAAVAAARAEVAALVDRAAIQAQLTAAMAERDSASELALAAAARCDAATAERDAALALADRLRADVDDHARRARELMETAARLRRRVSDLEAAGACAGPLPLAGTARYAPTLLVEQGVSGCACCVHDDEVFVGNDARECVDVFDGSSGALRRRICEGEFTCHVTGITFAGGVMFASHYGGVNGHCIVLHPPGHRYGGRFGVKGTGPGQLFRPYGLAAASGLVYVAEDGNHRVSIFREGGGFVSSAGSQGTGPGQLQKPHGVCTDGDMVFVAEHGNRRVSVHRAGDLLFERHIGVGVLGRVEGVCTWRELLFVADTDARSIIVFDVVDSRHVATLTGFGDGPQGVAVRADGTLFVTTCGSQLYRAIE